MCFYKKHMDPGVVFMCMGALICSALVCYYMKNIRRARYYEVNYSMETVKRYTKYGLVAPSHFAPDSLWKGMAENLFESVRIYSIHGLANWSHGIALWIEEIIKKDLPVIWMVSDVFLNNKDIHELRKMDDGQLFLPGVRGQPDNIDQALRTIENCRFLSNHTTKVIDHLISRFPQIKLCFWCLYMRTKYRSSITYPIECQYEAMRTRYSNNIIDIDWYLQRYGVKFEDCVRDEGGHPNRIGYDLLMEMFARETGTKCHSS